MSDLDEMKGKLRANKIADDNYLSDALCNCFAEIRAIYKSRTIDDRLAAHDAFVARLEAAICSDRQLTLEAQSYIDAGQLENAHKEFVGDSIETLGLRSLFAPDNSQPLRF